MAKLILDNGKIIGDYSKPYVVAELGSNHNGDMELAKKMIKQAKDAGCDCVKFQSWTKDTIFSKKVYDDNYFLNDDYRNRSDYTLEEIVDKFSISDDQLLDMKKYCDEIGIDCTSTPFSKHEVDYLVDVLKVPFIKIASMDLNNYPFLEYIAKKRCTIVLATGLSDLYEVDKAVRTIEEAGNNKICLLHCISVYPPEMKDIHLNNINTLRAMYPEYPIGFSDHTLGTAIPLASVALGVCMIEKHYTLDKNMFGWDHKVSANFEEMKTITIESNNIFEAMGSTRRVVSDAEMTKRNAFRRSIVAAKDIQAGEIIEEDMIAYKRPGTGIAPEYSCMIIGKTAKKDIKFDSMIDINDF